MSKIKILHIVEGLNIGGIQVFIMNLYRNINREKIQFDFLLSSKAKGQFEDEVLKMGGKIFRVTPRRESLLRNYIELKKFFSIYSNEYKCIHCHFSNLSNITSIVLARKYNIPIRILHSHSTNLPNNIIHKVLHCYNKTRIDKLATNFLACSDLSAEWLFGGTNGIGKTIIIRNGIELNKYKYREEIRNELRNELKLTGKLVFGAVGTFCEAKNHIFTLNLFKKILDFRPNSILLMAGIKKDNNEIINIIKNLKIDKNVMLLGFRNDIFNILNAFDVFIMPSKWEGFPVALLEAQASGLTCYVSDKVTTQAKINENVYYLSLEDGVDYWANYINKTFSIDNRIKNVDKLYKSGFDISNTVASVLDVYTE